MGEPLWWRFQFALVPTALPMRQWSSPGQAPPRVAQQKTRHARRRSTEASASQIVGQP